ncbi:MAG: SprT family zinc-dependent metalloprotease [Parcubacteria group bacterium]
MEKTIILGGHKIAYTLRKNRQSKHLRLSVSADASVRVTVPLRVSEKMAETFLRAKADWVMNRLADFAKRASAMQPPTRADYLKYKELAREIAEKKLQHFNLEYGYQWKKVAIRNTRTRWGSCSSSGNLNFSYRIIYLPAHLCDYIVVHELCHLGQFNHSAKFWNLVAQAVPDYKGRRREIKQM